MLFKNAKVNENEESMQEASEDMEYANGLDATGEEAARTAELERSVEDARDQLLRRTAEMDNMRRRFNQEREQLIFESNKRLLTDLLPTLDDMERTLEHAGNEKGAVVQGLELIHKNLVKLVERYGVTPMEVLGKPFDVHAHDALMEEGRTDVEPGTITKEIQKGYLLNDSVLRHAKVIVAKNPE